MNHILHSFELRSSILSMIVRKYCRREEKKKRKKIRVCIGCNFKVRRDKKRTKAWLPFRRLYTYDYVNYSISSSCLLLQRTREERKTMRFYTSADTPLSLFFFRLSFDKKKKKVKRVILDPKNSS